jgi:hypothetical protein
MEPVALLDRVRIALRARHGSRRTEKAYVVRGGKGDRDRATMLPAALALDLAKHLDTVRDL